MKNPDEAQLIGASAQMTELKQEILRIARSDAKVLITGESGVGKELVARAIHFNSNRVDKPYIAMNCAGLPETLLESELFGHVKGSFTGAYRDKPGKLESAHDGTIFLDEVGEMTLRMQGLLLRFLETGELQKVGADRGGRIVNVRLVAATNRNLQDLILKEQFREDLYYRLNVIHFVVPPLRERREDIPLMIEHFLRRFTSMSNGHHSVRGFEPDAFQALVEYAWPGNVRELENVLERLVVTGRNELIRMDDLPPEIKVQRGMLVRPKRERRRTVADDLYKKLLDDKQSFWTVVYPLYMEREITKQNVRDLVRRGLEEARGNYKIVCRMFNMEQNDYKRFLNFLRKHDCQLPFKEFR
ncbi:MAG: sigma-54 interaction domain-containing protein [Luteitalea sp.]|nr:sigma-54-dependent Fis family transcriptional regulator [Acidobacteriota bacterium]